MCAKKRPTWQIKNANGQSAVILKESGANADLPSLKLTVRPHKEIHRLQPFDFRGQTCRFREGKLQDLLLLHEIILIFVYISNHRVVVRLSEP